LPSLTRILRRLRSGTPTSPRGIPESAFEHPKTWEERTALALASDDNRFLPRHPDAGAIRDGAQVMHNGILVPTGGYYGPENAKLLQANRGVHEPQEERVFAAVLEHIPHGAFMIELGSYWAFYSSWFLAAVPQSRALLVEPDPKCLEVGRQTLALNGLTGRADFIPGWVGKFPPPHPTGARATTVDELVRSGSIDHVNILHADVQGEECRMLRGCRESFARNLFDWVFLSTHSMYRHAECRRIMARRGFIMVAEADMPESYSYDGLLVYKRPGVPGPDRVDVSQRPYPAL